MCIMTIQLSSDVKNEVIELVKTIRKDKLSTLPISDEVKDIFCNIMTEFHMFEHTRETAQYAISRVLNYLHDTDETIENDLFNTFKENNLFEDVNEENIQHKIKEHVLKIVSLFRPLLNDKCIIFYKHILGRLICNQPFFMIIFEDDKWQQVNSKFYQHVEAGNVFKEIDSEDETNFRIWQSDYFIFVDDEGQGQLSQQYSYLDVTHMIALDPTNHCPISKDKLDEFNTWFKENQQNIEDINSMIPETNVVEEE